MPFELYSRTAGRNLGINPDPVISIQQSGSIAFSGGAQRLLNVTERDAVVLLFDATIGQIGIRAYTSGDPPATKLTLRNNNPGKGCSGSALGISASGFLKRFKIDKQRVHGMHRLIADDRSGLTIVQLPSGSWQRPVNITPIRERLNGKRHVS